MINKSNNSFAHIDSIFETGVDTSVEFERLKSPSSWTLEEAKNSQVYKLYIYEKKLIYTY